MDADKTYSGEYLFQRYLTSVGRNANLLIGCVPDTDGLISEDQVDSFRSLGELVNRELGVHAGMTETLLDGERMEVWFDGPVDAEYIELMEDQTEGQHVLEWVVETRWPAYWCTKDGLDRWVPLAQGQSIGHKRIIPLGKMAGLRLPGAHPEEPAGHGHALHAGVWTEGADAVPRFHRRLTEKKSGKRPSCGRKSSQEGFSMGEKSWWRGKNVI